MLHYMEIFIFAKIFKLVDMRTTIITLCIAFMALALPQQTSAQKNENAHHEDSYYLKGAVPEVNGKVVFSKEFNITGMSKGEVYAKVQEWMKARMQQNANKSSVAYENEERDGEEYIVFSNSILALDRTKVIYQMIANCDEGKCVLQIRNIRYDYPNEKEIFVAEDWITDKMALTKDQSRLARGFAKWRRKTVDFVDDMNESLQKALSGFEIVQNDGKPEETRKSDAVAVVSSQVTTKEAEPEKPVATAAAPAINPAIPVAVVNDAAEVVKPAVQPVVETTAVAEEVKPVVAVEPVKPAEPVVVPVAKPVETKVAEPVEAKPAEAFPELTADKVQASNGKLVIIIGDDEFNRTTMTANAGGYLSSSKGKKYINTILTPEQSYQALEQAKEYTVAFYPNGANQPSVVMKCLNATKEKPGRGRANIFVGEITNVETH